VSGGWGDLSVLSAIEATLDAPDKGWEGCKKTGVYGESVEVVIGW